MAYQDYRPDYEYLWSLGFVETDSGEDHPYDRWNELKLNEEAVLHMDCFWDFTIEPFDGANFTPICFSCNSDIEEFIKIFRQ